MRLTLPRPAVATPAGPMTPPTPPAEPSGPRCPTCGGPVAWADNLARPFCCLTCTLVDLGGWLDETHRIAGDPIPSEPSSDADVPRPEA